MPRPIPCPLCSTLLLPRHMGSEGICMTCADARRDSRRAATASAQEKEAKREGLAARTNDIVLTARENTIAERVARAKQQELEAERKQLKTIYREQASVALARNSLLHYVERKVGPKYLAGWVHEHLTARLEKFLHDIELGKSPRLILQLGPRTGKSEIASDCFPAWVLGHHPDMPIIITSYSDELPLKFSRSIREQIQSEQFRAVFPKGAHISKDDAAAGAWSTVEKGGVRAVGVAGSLIGQGAALVVVDDAVQNEVVGQNPLALEKLFTWFTTTLYSRLNSGGHSGIILIGQRWSVNDLQGRVLKRQAEEEAQVASLRIDADDYEANGDHVEAKKLRNEADELDASMDRWESVKYPALATADQYLTDGGEIIDLPSEMPPDPAWRLLRKEGEALQPERFTRNYFLKLKRNQPRLFQALYQQVPLDEDNSYFGIDDFVRYQVGRAPKGMIKYVGWDLAISTKTTADRTAGVCVGIDYSGNIYLLDKIALRAGDIRQVADLILDMHKRNEAMMTGIEHTHIAQALGPILKDRMRDRQDYIVLAEGKEKLVPVTDKLTRGRPLQALAKNGKVFVPDTDAWDEWLAEMIGFGGTGHDDLPDATIWATTLALRNPPPRDPSKLEKAAGTVRDIYDRLFRKFDSTEGGSSYMES